MEDGEELQFARDAVAPVAVFPARCVRRGRPAPFLYQRSQRTVGRLTVSLHECLPFIHSASCIVRAKWNVGKRQMAQF